MAFTYPTAFGIGVQAHRLDRDGGRVVPHGTRTVRSPGASGWTQTISTSASGRVFVLTAMVPASISSISEGNSPR